MATLKTFWPAPEKKINDLFGTHSPERKAMGLGPHRGLDFTVPVGTSLKAIGNGTVSDVYHSEILGWVIEQTAYVVVDGKPKVMHFAYCHLDKKPALKKGDKVKGGEEICKSGNSGASSGPHLHFMAGSAGHLASSAVVDPLPLIKSALNGFEV